MKVWITKYALTDGIIEGEVIGCKNDDLVFYDGQIKDGGEHLRKRFGEWCISKEEAIQKAEEMRQKKIASLKKQIEKLEEIRFK